MSFTFAPTPYLGIFFLLSHFCHCILIKNTIIVLFFADIVSLRNIQPELRNPFLKINALLSKEFETTEKNRPFTTIEHDNENLMFELELCLLPHQKILFSTAFQRLVQVAEDSILQVKLFNIETIRYKINYFIFPPFFEIVFQQLYFHSLIFHPEKAYRPKLTVLKFPSTLMMNSRLFFHHKFY